MIRHPPKPPPFPSPTLSRSPIGADRVALAVAGRTSQLAQYAGIRLPIESHVLQAFVSEGIKPLIPGVLVFGAGAFYISQSDKDRKSTRLNSSHSQISYAVFC